MNFFGNGSCGEGCGFGMGNCCWIIVLLLLCSSNCSMGSVDVCTLIMLLLLLGTCSHNHTSC